MRFTAFKKLLTNNHRFKPEDADYRRVCLLNAILLSFIGFAVLFAILNAVSGYSGLAAVQAVISVLCCITLLYFHKTDSLKISSYAVVVIMIGMYVAMLSDAGHSRYILIWCCACPPLVFFLLGQKKGLLVSIAFVVYVALHILLGRGSWGPAEFGSASVVNVIGALLTVILLIGYFELTRNEAALSVRTKNDELMEAVGALHTSREELRLILDSTAEAIFGVDMKSRCTFCNTSCLEMLGLGSESDLLGADMYELLHSRRRDGSPLPRSECNIVRTCMEGVPFHADDEVFWRPGGVSFDVEYNSYPQYKDGEVVGAVVTFSDNTLKRLHEQQIEYLSTHDSLTGLLNRSCFEMLLRRTDRKSSLPISVIMGDLNGLKLMNDIFGHNAGDELLVKAAEILRKACRADDMIARLGGDEFVILLPKTQRRDAELIIDRIRDGLKNERVSTISCSMSLGCDTKENADQGLGLVLQKAENEMYGDKTLNRSQISADMINALIMMLFQKNPWEEQHSANVSGHCKAIGEAMGLSGTELVQLRSAGFLHDIGKVGIDPKLVVKRGPLSEEEEQEHRQHPVIGYRILNLFDNTLGLADSVYSHHERWDGKGFPRGICGTEIPLMARIIAVAGWYDLILRGLYSSPATREEAIAWLRREAGLRLDPQIVDVFTRILDKEDAL